MSTIQLNGSAQPLAAGTTVADLVTAMTGRALLANGPGGRRRPAGCGRGPQLGHCAAQPMGGNPR